MASRRGLFRVDLVVLLLAHSSWRAARRSSRVETAGIVGLRRWAQGQNQIMAMIGDEILRRAAAEDAGHDERTLGGR